MSVIFCCPVIPGSSRQSTGVGDLSRGVAHGVIKPVQHLALNAGKGVYGAFALVNALDTQHSS
jgi:hypothetical protein